MSIRVNDRFEIRPDDWCWVLVEHVQNDASHHKTKRATRELKTYHANLVQCCRVILERTGNHRGENCQTLAEVLEKWDRVCGEIHESVSGIPKADGSREPVQETSHE